MLWIKAVQSNKEHTEQPVYQHHQHTRIHTEETHTEITVGPGRPTPESDSGFDYISAG